ncbi:DUF362 domain-containing protein [Desulfotomaculum copahuensis]|uniref:DUF362 domain-containing protein n=1 Tax=Desulfotomaculum copahuensis TaxID=1838280 RepID=A0A1B7LIF1_9FIRM|nr:DUF362 domain-containing protein [Desulfotomaculum copahuensis]OAT86162.1 hypothetical protein A6M21_16910 [Desulfotomaculum copahuensis]
MSKPLVSLVVFSNPYQSVRQALQLCDGLAGLDKSDKILIKPNLVTWDFNLPFPPYGVVTTAAVMSALVRILNEEGFRHLTIGEAPLMIPKTIGQAMYKTLGYDKLREKYGVALVDFNEEKFETVDFGDFKLSLAKRALEADKIINLPVLKTHNQCQVSLGIKNLKGCLNRKSKMYCHGKDVDLDHMFPHIIEKLPVALTIIDGVYTLAKGPGPTGNAYRKNVLVASRDFLACDVVGAGLMGYDAGEVEHLKYFAGRHNQSTNLKDIEVRGEEISKHSAYIESDFQWDEANTGPAGFHKRGISGLAIRKYDSSLCTGCSMMYNPMLIMFMSAYKGRPFPNMELVSGKRQVASLGFDYTMLFGKCACSLNKDNPHIKKVLPVKGCPPTMEDFEEAMKEAGLTCDYNQYVSYRHYIYSRYKKEDGFDMGLYTV